MDVRMPDGTVIKNVPEGTTKSEILRRYEASKSLSNNASGGSGPIAPPMPPRSASDHLRDIRARFELGTAPESVQMGVSDPIHGGAQLLTKALPEGVVSPGNQFNNWLAEKTGIVPRLPEGGVDQQVREREQAYQQRRQARGDTGIDIGRMAGNMISTGPVAGGLTGAGMGLATRSAIGGAGGAGLSAFQPVTGPGDYWQEKGGQVAAGGIGGAVGAPLTAGLARMISPKSSDAVRALRSEGVSLTPGKALGGMWRTAEEKAQSLPLAGAQIRNATIAGNESLNRAAINRSLFAIGERLPKGKVGHAAIGYADEALSKAYDKVIGKIGAAPVDDVFLGDLAALQGKVANAPKETAERLWRVIDNEILSRTENGKISGEAIKGAEANLGALARGLRKSQDYDTREFGKTIIAAQVALRNWLERVAPPGVADELKRVNSGWANFLRVQRAASSVAAPEGVFTPAQLHSAVKAFDPSRNKGAFSEGRALMQDLSGTAKKVMGDTVPNSGTADRAMLAYLGSSALNPTQWPGLATQAAGLTALSLPYMPGIRQATTAAVAGRQGPQWRSLSEGLRALSPALGAELSKDQYGLLDLPQ